MIPILFDSKEKDFLTNGIGALADAVSCIVIEERNGVFVLEMQYPVTGVHYNALENDRLILAKPNETAQDQPFRIYDITIPIRGIVTVYAEHISYQTVTIPVFPFEANSASEAVSKLVSYSATDNPFTFATDKETVGKFTVSAPVNFRSRLYGTSGSLLDVYGGGDYEFDRWNIYLRNKRGNDNGVTIEYGKNLTDIKQELSISSLINGIAPFWMDSEGKLVTLPEKVIVLQNDYSYPRVETLDLSEKFEEAPTPDELRDAANKYLETTTLTVPKINLTVSFIPLWQTENYKENPLYKQIGGLERVSLCDTVTVRFPALGVNSTARVIKTIYDCLLERYNSIELGEPKSTVVSRSVSQQVEISESVTSGMMEKWIQNATNAITGASGGYVVLDPPRNPQRILILDTPNKETAVRVWQFNLNGLAFSDNGIEGPYKLAMTTNPGAIVADFITAGTLNANVIRAGTIMSIDGKTFFNLETGVLETHSFINGIPHQVRISDGNLEQFIDGDLAGGVYAFPDQTTGNPFSVAACKQLRVKDGSTDKLAVSVDQNNKVVISGDMLSVNMSGGGSWSVATYESGQSVIRAGRIFISGREYVRKLIYSTDWSGYVLAEV